MKKIAAAFALFALAGWGATGAQAHPGHDHGQDLRVWKSADGPMEALFVLARDDRVLLCRLDSTTLWLPLAQLSREDRDWVRERSEAIRRLNEAKTSPLPPALTAVSARAEGEKEAPAIQKSFEPFKNKLNLRSDANWLYVESDGLPDHPMMVGIKAWQQQVPLPQPYTGRNAWQIPLKPRLAEKPISAKTALFRGAIALAVNGVPIFNALNNRGVDSYLIGELDEYGGHCGRADDYHYHAAPVHLEKMVGKGQPIGYALDGFPLYGFTDRAGQEPKDLDAFNGRMEAGGYRYYSTKKYPYINGGLRGVVTVSSDNNEVLPQPKAGPVREAGRPLPGARITDFVRDDAKKAYLLKYQVRDQTYVIKYAVNPNGTFTFTFVDENGKGITETYARRARKEGPGGKKDGKKDEKKEGKKERKKEGQAGNPNGPAPPSPRTEAPMPKTLASSKFKVTSPAFEHGGTIPVEYTGDGAGVSPPVAWSGAPEGTKFYALQLWHVPKPGPAPDEVKSYWVLYDIPANVTRLAKNTKGVGTAGYNGKDRTDYDPMKSKGPGVKEYHITVYALSAQPKFAGAKVTREDLLAAVKEITLAESTLSYQYERTGQQDGGQPPPKKKKDRKE